MNDIDYIKKYCDIVRASSSENEVAIKWLYENKLYKKVVGTLREELELYAKTVYLLSQSKVTREYLLRDFFQNNRWKNARDKILTDGELISHIHEIGAGWERISYTFACLFVHLSVLHNWSNEDVTKIIDPNQKKIIVDYINSYHSANLSDDCTFEDIMQYSLDIFEKIKGNMECYLEKLERG